MQSANRYGRAPKAIAGVVFAVLPLVASCGEPATARSTALFCSTMQAEKARILGRLRADQRAVDASKDDFVKVVGSLAASVAALGDLRVYMARLAATAPPEIQPQAEEASRSVAKQIDAVTDNADNPLKGLLIGVIAGMTSSNSMRALHEWALKHCGEGI